MPRLVLRIATDDSKAVCRLSVKFGAPLKACRGLLERAKELGLDVIGVSFHVGSGCTDPETYSQAIADSRCVFDMGVCCARLMYAYVSLPSKADSNSLILLTQDELGFKMDLLDIGGGFPGSDDAELQFEEVSYFFFFFYFYVCFVCV